MPSPGRTRMSKVAIKRLRSVALQRGLEANCV